MGAVVAGVNEPIGAEAAKASALRLMSGPPLPVGQGTIQSRIPTAEGMKGGYANSAIRIVASASKLESAEDSPVLDSFDAAKLVQPAAELKSPPPAVLAAKAKANNQAEMVCMSRELAWTKFMAYEACMQVCVKAVMDGTPEASTFLQDSCDLLKKAFGCDKLTLKPPAPGGPSNVPGGPKLSWTEEREIINPAAPNDPLLRAQVAGFEAALKDGRAVVPNTSKVHVSLHALSQPEDRGVWTSLASAAAHESIEMTTLEQSSSLKVEVHNDMGLVAEGTNSILALWQLTDQAIKPEQPAAQAKSKAGLWGRRTGAAPDQRPPPQPIEVFDKAGVSMGRVMLHTAIVEASAVAAAPRPIVRQPLAPVHINTWQVYDTVLASALEAQGCGQRNLTLSGPWRWLLREVAAAYGVRPTFAALAYLRWAAAPGRLTPTADCLSMLAQELRPLKRVESNLLAEEKKVLDEVSAACEALLAATFEGYHSLSEKEPTGILAGGASGPETPAPALAPAVRLFGILKDEGKLRDQTWLQDRLRVAAVRRYARLHRNCIKRITENGYVLESARSKKLAPIEESGKPTPETLAYRRMEALCESIRAELENDRLISEHAVLLPCIDLPSITAPEYCHELVAKIQETLEAAPPLKPSTPAVDLLLAVGRLQDFVKHSGVAVEYGGRGDLDAPALFAPHIHAWIDASQDRLCKLCMQLESKDPTTPQGSPRKHAGPAVVPLVPAMLDALNTELADYQRIITYWPQFGAALESAMCAALRDTLAATSRHCGLVQAMPQPTSAPAVETPKDSSPRKLFGRKNKVPAEPATLLTAPPVTESPTKSPSKRAPWQWRAPNNPHNVAMLHKNASIAQTGVAPHEAMLLNSLRQLLSAAPATEETVTGWCATGRKVRRQASGSVDGFEHAGSDGSRAEDFEEFNDPQLGVHFLQVVCELRSQYAVAIKLAAQRLADAVFASPGAAPMQILDQLWQAIGPVIGSSQPYWQRLSQPADPGTNSKQHVKPLLKVLEQTCAELQLAVDPRVLVALTRGLWELTAREIFDYLEGLQEGFDTKNAWRSRQNAALMLDHVDVFFSESLAAAANTNSKEGALNEKDLERPFHSEKAHKLLSSNTAAENVSFNVY